LLVYFVYYGQIILDFFLNILYCSLAVSPQLFLIAETYHQNILIKGTVKLLAKLSKFAELFLQSEKFKEIRDQVDRELFENFDF
jgi:hypothetical protein